MNVFLLKNSENAMKVDADREPASQMTGSNLPVIVINEVSMIDVLKSQSSEPTATSLVLCRQYWIEQ